MSSRENYGVTHLHFTFENVPKPKASSKKKYDLDVTMKFVEVINLIKNHFVKDKKTKKASSGLYRTHKLDAPFHRFLKIGFTKRSDNETVVLF